MTPEQVALLAAGQFEVHDYVDINYGGNLPNGRDADYQTYETPHCTIRELATMVEALRRLLHSGAWHRHCDYPGEPVSPTNLERTYLAIRMPDGADLSCKAMRDDAIDAVLADKGGAA